MKLEAGKIAVVTGAASGIGLALAERFAASGMHVVLADVDEGALEAAAERITGRGVQALTVRTDVSDEASVQALAAAAVERFGAVHVVCNNAGVMSSADPWFGPLSAWTWLLGVNLWGVIHGVRAFLPVLAAQAEGHIVNTASIAGLYPGFGAVVRRDEACGRGDHRRPLHVDAPGRAADRRERAVPRLGAHEHPRRRSQLARRSR